MAESLVQIGGTERQPAGGGRAPRPAWLRIQLATPAEYHRVRKLVEDLTSTPSARRRAAPTSTSAGAGTARRRFMILGDVCTRRCGFCAVTSGRPAKGTDAGEPAHVAEAVAAMGLRHAVITSVDRDDLPDGGARALGARDRGDPRAESPAARSKC